MREKKYFFPPSMRNKFRIHFCISLQRCEKAAHPTLNFFAWYTYIFENLWNYSHYATDSGFCTLLHPQGCKGHGFCSCDRTKKGSFTEFLIYLFFICTLLGFHENFCFLFSRTFIFVLRENCLWKLMKILIVIANVCANMFTKTEIFYKFCRTTWLFLFIS